MQHETPVEYELLKEVVERSAMHRPPPELIEAVAYASEDDFFRKPKFRQCLIEYREYGCKPTRTVKTNARKELFYIRKRLRSMLIET